MQNVRNYKRAQDITFSEIAKTLKERGPSGIIIKSNDIILYLCAEQVINGRFKSNNVFEFVDINNPLVIQNGETIEQRRSNNFININEFMFNEPVPIEANFIDDVITTRLANANQILNTKLAIPGTTAGEARKYTADHLNKIAEIQSTQKDSLTNQFTDRKKTWERKRDEHREKQALTLTTWYKTYDQAVLSCVNEMLLNYQFIRAKCVLDDKFRVDSTSGNASENFQSILSNLEFELQHIAFDLFFKIYRTVCERLGQLGTRHSDKTLASYFFSAMKKLNNIIGLDLRNLVSHWELSHTTTEPNYWTDLEMEFSAEFATYFAKYKEVRYKNFNNQQVKSVSNNVQVKVQSTNTNSGEQTFAGKRTYQQSQSTSGPNYKSDKQCNKCNRAGHTSDTCEVNVTCSYCGNIGHGDWRCMSNPDAGEKYFKAAKLPKLSTYRGIKQDPRGVKVTNKELQQYNNNGGKVDFSKTNH